MTVQEAIGRAQERARQLHVDPQVTVSEVYEAELLRRLQQKLRGQLIWKGGTVLRLEGSERFSRDLDATRRSTPLSPSRLAKVLREVADGLPYLADVETSVQPQSVTGLYRFTVPSIRQTVRIEIEVSTRERPLTPATTITTARIAHPYGLQPVVIARLDGPELLAEKVRALVMRRANRDIYDVYTLLQRGTKFDASLFLKKMNYYQKLGKPVDAVVALERAARHCESYDSRRAKGELANLLPPSERGLDFGVILEDVAKALRAWAIQLSSLQSDKSKR